jgi:chitinase
MKLITPILLVLLVACGIQTPLPTTPVPESTPDVFSALTPDSAQPFAVIGYLPDYRALDPEWGKYVTDIIYFSAEPTPSGGLDTSRLNEDTFKALREMKARYGTRIHISVGGWERSDGFAPMTANAKTRQAFVQNLLKFSLSHELDGVDLDWEFPEDESELANYISLLTEIKNAFAEHGMTVSVALSPDFKDSLSSYTVTDRIHIMSYDRGARHSTYEQAVADLQLFLDAGIPPEKLILGIPFYGRNITSPYDEFTYAEIIEQYHPAPDVDEVDDIFFNDVETVQLKTCHAMGKNIGGVMVWELAQDTMDKTSLLAAIKRAVFEGCK